MIRIFLIVPLLIACGEEKLVEGVAVGDDDPVGDTASGAVLFPLDWEKEPVGNSLGMFRISKDDTDVFLIHVPKATTLTINSWGSALVRGTLTDVDNTVMQEGAGFYFTAAFKEAGFYYLTVSTDDEKVDVYGLEIAEWDGGPVEFVDPNQSLSD